MAAPGEGEHKHPAYLLEFAEKIARDLGGQAGRAYVMRLAIWVRRGYPGSAPQLIPKLREIYKSIK